MVSIKNRSTTMLVTQSQDVISRYLPSRKRIQDKNWKTTRVAPMEVWEFARIVAILCEREEARSALISSGCDLMLQQQQKRKHRDEFWEIIVTSFLNDSDVMLGLSLLGLVDGDEGFNNLSLNREIVVPRYGS